MLCFASPLPSQILRAQPANIYEFGARYFAELVEENAAALQMQMSAEEQGMGGEMGGGSVFDMSNEELQDFIMDMFLQFDADASGGAGPGHQRCPHCLLKANLYALHSPFDPHSPN